jgi:hypothetical protein
MKFVLHCTTPSHWIKWGGGACWVSESLFLSLSISVCMAGARSTRGLHDPVGMIVSLYHATEAVSCDHPQLVSANVSSKWHHIQLLLKIRKKNRSYWRSEREISTIYLPWNFHTRLQISTKYSSRKMYMPKQCAMKTYEFRDGYSIHIPGLSIKPSIKAVVVFSLRKTICCKMIFIHDCRIEFHII